MARKIRNTFLCIPLSILFVFLILHRYYLHPQTISFYIISVKAISSDRHHLQQLLLPPTSAIPLVDSTPLLIINNSESYSINITTQSHRDVLDTVSVLLPAWEVLVIVSPDDTTSLTKSDGVFEYDCLYPNNDFTSAKPVGLLTSPDRAAFKCLLPKRSRRNSPFRQPVLIRNSTNPPRTISPAPELLRWSHVVYDSSVTADDVVVFAKGLNKRQGINRDPSEFRCVFYREKGDVENGVRTVVTSSNQEVFRCKRPNLAAVEKTTTSVTGGVGENRIKVTLETVQNHMVPTLAYYNYNYSYSTPKLAEENGKSLLCACTMVYNVAKFLKEWVVYHSSIGIEKFILYDNESDDNLEEIVGNLNQQGYDVKTYFWLWPKTQESGFSQSVLYAKDSCTWMAYIDVDEFMYSPSWLSSPNPLKSMLQDQISKLNMSGTELLGQLNIGCHEFGPSNQTVHPENGVTQGYNCRRKYKNRHKSIVLMEAIDDNLHNAIHHFSLKPGYLTKKVGIESMMVNHYKFQAWSEFRAKFRRRVSAYVVDWTNQVNPHSNDRTPGLGFSPIEPPDWPQKFCEVHDNGLRDLTRKWFGLRSPGGFKISWQR